MQRLEFTATAIRQRLRKIAFAGVAGWLGVGAAFALGQDEARAQGSEPRLLIPAPGGGIPQAPSVPQPQAVQPPTPLGTPSTTAMPGANPALARLEVRMSQLEQDLRSVTGRMEDVSFQLRKLDDRLDKLAADMEFRLGQGKPAEPAAAASVAGIAAGASAGAGNDAAMPSARSGDATAPNAAGAPSSPAQQTASLPPKTPRELYARAFAQLEKHQYEDSAAGFSEFLKANPEDPLADNARYWLGETYYARGEYGRSAELFLDAYEKNKTGPKAPDTLLKLGLSLASLNKTREACATFRELGRAFPNAPDAVKDRAGQESKRLACS